MNRLVLAIMISNSCLIGIDCVNAQNLLINGNFELIEPDLPGWMVQETVTGMPSLIPDSVGQAGFANQPSSAPGEFGAWLKNFAGNVGQPCCFEQNLPTNGIISQTVPVIVGEQYTFSGWSKFEASYAGGVDTLDPSSPSGAVPSPTSTTFLLEFLDAGGSVIGSPQMLDIKADRISQSPVSLANDVEWYQHTLMGTAPTGAANVRVTAQATDMLSNTGSQSAFVDNFSLTGASSPGTQLLENADMNITPPELSGWTLVEVGSGMNQDTAGRAGNFADNPNSPGDFGFWLKAFAEGDATLSQRVAGVEGQEYEFSAWSAFGANYSGGTGPSKPATLTLMELAFLDADEEEIEAPLVLDLWDEGQRNAAGPIADNPEAWAEFALGGTAPAGTEFVEVRVKAIGMVTGDNPDPSAFFDDLSLTIAGALEGDYNQDGKVDAADYVSWRRGNINGAAGYQTWRENFGATASGGGAGGNLLSAGSVPEPSCLVLMFVALTTGFALRGVR